MQLSGMSHPMSSPQARAQAEQELGGTGTGVAAVDDDAVTRRQFEILESESVRPCRPGRQGTMGSAADRDDRPPTAPCS